MAEIAAGIAARVETTAAPTAVLKLIPAIYGRVGVTALNLPASLAKAECISSAESQRRGIRAPVDADRIAALGSLLLTAARSMAAQDSRAFAMALG